MSCNQFPLESSKFLNVTNYLVFGVYIVYIIEMIRCMVPLRVNRVYPLHPLPKPRLRKGCNQFRICCSVHPSDFLGTADRLWLNQKKVKSQGQGISLCFVSTGDSILVFFGGHRASSPSPLIRDLQFTLLHPKDLETHDV